MDYTKETQQWIGDFVIGLNLCPFAKKPFDEEQIRYNVYEGEDAEALTLKLIHELNYLTDNINEVAETSVLIIPNFLQNFQDYLDYLSFTEELLESLNLVGIIQIASFHPDYQFANTTYDEVSNFTNRSPYPMLHLLRESSVEWAVNNHPNTEEIPNNNIEKMKNLGLEKIKALIKKQ